MSDRVLIVAISFFSFIFITVLALLNYTQYKENLRLLGIINGTIEIYGERWVRDPLTLEEPRLFTGDKP